MSIKGLLFALTLSVLAGYMLTITAAPELPTLQAVAVSLVVGLLITGLILLPFKSHAGHQD